MVVHLVRLCQRTFAHAFDVHDEYLHAFGSLVLNTVDVVHSPEEGLVSVSVSKLVLLKEP